MNGSGRAPRRVPSLDPNAEPVHRDGSELRRLVQAFIRRSGVLASHRTPCGKPLPVSHAHALMVLLECGRAGHRPTERELGAILGIDKSNVTRLCRKMQQVGHLLLERSPFDGRALLLALTDLGARAGQELERASHARFERVVEAIPTDARRRVLSALAVLNEALAASAEAAREEPATAHPGKKAASS